MLALRLLPGDCSLLEILILLSDLVIEGLLTRGEFFVFRQEPLLQFIIGLQVSCLCLLGVDRGRGIDLGRGEHGGLLLLYDGL